MNEHRHTGTTGTLNWPLLLHAFSIISFALVYCCLPLSFELHTVNNLIVSDATINGTHVSSRVQTAYTFIVAGAACVLLVYRLLKYLVARTRLNLLRQEELILISTASLCLCFLQAMEIQSIVTLKILHLVFWLRVAMLLTGNKTGNDLLADKMVFSLSLCYAFFLMLAVLFLWGGHDWVKEHSVWLFFTLFVSCISAYVSLNHFLHRSAVQVSLLLLPLAAIPLLAFLSLELLFYFRQEAGYFIRFRLIFGLSLTGIFVAAFLWLRRCRIHRPERLIRNLVGPSIIFAFVLLSYYKPVMHQHTDLFEYGNYANPVMKIFRFGKIPLLDFCSSHMLSEQWFGCLYTLIFGYNDRLDFIVYTFLNGLVFLLALYWFFNRLFHRPLVSLFFVLLFPLLNEVFYAFVFLAVFPLLFSRQLLEKPRPKTFLGLFLVLSALILWRIDTGSATVMASLFYFPLLWFAARKKFPVPAFFKGLLLFLLTLSAGLAFTMMLRSPEIILGAVNMALHYFSANQAHGYKQIIYSFTQQFYILYVLLPAAGIAACIYILAALRRMDLSRTWSRSFLLLSSLFLFLLFFANLQRALVRHGYAEGEDLSLTSTFFAASGLLAVYWCPSQRAAIQAAVFYIVSFFAFFILKFFPFKMACTALEAALTRNAFRNIDYDLFVDAYRGRMKPDTAFANKNYTGLRQFLDQHLQPGQTFLDFSNTPMLYYYCNRESPGYFTQNLQNSNDDYLQLSLLKQADTARAPVVVFASYPREWLDHLDEVPNALRYYLVAEHIFSYYVPYGIIGNKSVWISRSLAPVPSAAQADTLLAQAEVIPLNLLPEYTGAFYAEQPEALQTARVFGPKDLVLHNDSLRIRLDESILSWKHCYLAIEFRPRQEPFDPYPVELRLLDSNLAAVGAFPFIRRDKVSSRYLIRLSNHYFWHRHSRLEIDIAPAGEVKQISILKDTRFAD